MSYRELRSFSETMRLLGYPSLISMESFRTPNVELVADCLYWLIKRYEPSAEVDYNIVHQSDRVFFFKQICEAALTKARIRLNIKKLYQCDGHAVQEMLKLANVLKKATKSVNGEEPDFTSLQQMAAQKNVHEAKAVQQLCSDLTSDGSSLFFLVEEEMQSRGNRQHVLSRATEVGEFERRLRELLTNVAQQVEQLQQSITNLSADETNLEQKIENKKTQLERAQKRYRSLMAVRPAYVEEYDKHEAELQAQFVKYLEQYRNLEYLEHQLAKFNAKEDALLKEQQTMLSVMRERLRKEELKTIRNGSAKRGGVRGSGGGQPLASDGDTDESEDESGHNGHAPSGARVRNAAQEGSSVSSEGSTDDDDSDKDTGEAGTGNGTNFLTGARSGPSPSSELAKRQQRPSNGGGGGPFNASPGGRPPMAAAGRGAGNFHAVDESNETSSDDTSDYSTGDDDTSAVTTTDDDDDDDDTTSSDDSDI